MVNLIQRGGPIMYPLLFCSVISLTVIIERAIFWIRERRLCNEKLIETIINLAEKDNHSSIEKLGGNSNDYRIRVLMPALKHHCSPINNVVAAAANNELRRMKRYMDILDTIITLAPLLGILGTVLGIISSFDILGIYGIKDPQSVVSGIAQALITTATGLTIALFTLIPYNYFNSRLNEAAEEIQYYSSRLEAKKAKDANDTDS